MKNIFLFILVLFLGTNTVFAADRSGSDSDTKATSTDSGSFYLGFGAGADLPGTNWSPNYTLGGGADFLAGYAFDKNWAVQLNEENWFFEGNSFSLYNFRSLASIKYTFSVEGWQPYLLAGSGIAYSSLLGSGAVNLDAVGGLGFQFDMTTDTHFFVEGRYNFILPSTESLQDIPLSAGIWVNLP
jgi:hypothetical protein